MIYKLFQNGFQTIPNGLQKNKNSYKKRFTNDLQFVNHKNMVSNKLET